MDAKKTENKFTLDDMSPWRRQFKLDRFAPHINVSENPLVWFSLRISNLRRTSSAFHGLR